MVWTRKIRRFELAKCDGALSWGREYNSCYLRNQLSVNWSDDKLSSNKKQTKNTLFYILLTHYHWDAFGYMNNWIIKVNIDCCWHAIKWKTVNFALHLLLDDVELVSGNQNNYHLSNSFIDLTLHWKCLSNELLTLQTSEWLCKLI